MSGFEERVKQWMLGSGTADVADVVSVEAYGDDWYGNTMEGFDQHFKVEISYTTTSGARRSCDVEGSELESMWRTVVR